MYMLVTIIYASFPGSSCIMKRTVIAVYHGKSGPLVVTSNEVTALSEAFVNGGAQLGYRVRDLNGEDQFGE